MHIFQMLIHFIIQHEKITFFFNYPQSHQKSLGIGSCHAHGANTSVIEFEFSFESLNCIIGDKYCQLSLKRQAHLLHFGEDAHKCLGRNNHSHSVALSLTGGRGEEWGLWPQETRISADTHDKHDTSRVSMFWVFLIKKQRMRDVQTCPRPARSGPSGSPASAPPQSPVPAIPPWTQLH